MSPEMVRNVLELIESEIQRRPSPVDFEMAYQIRVSIDRIKIAIKCTEEFGPRSEQMRQIGLQLLDALDRLDAAERHFQKRFRHSSGFNVDRPEAQSDHRGMTANPVNPATVER
jgi:hypothetical protein